MKRYRLVALLFLPLLSIAQSNYKSGFVVALKGDTLHGYINLKEWGHNPKDISFKATINDKALQMGLSEINYFEVTGYARYRQYHVAISSNPIDISAPASTADTVSETDNVFLKILQPGKNVTLYTYKDNIKERFYIQESQQGQPVELFYGIYEDANGSDKVISKNTYQSQLIQLVLKYNPGNDKLIARIQQSAYQDENMIAIVAQINGDAIPREAAFAGAFPRYRLFAGIAYELSTMRNSAFQPLGLSPSTTGAPKFNLGIDVFANPSVGHLIFRLEVAYANHIGYQFSGQTLSQSTVSVIPQVTYNLYNADALKIFVNVGYAVNFSSYGNSDSSVALSYADKWGEPQLKAGIVVAKKVEIYGSYYPSTPLNNFTGFGLRLSSYQFGVNYFFGKAAH